MLFSPAFTFSSISPLGVLPCAGLRLSWLHQLQAFLASGACAASASSYHFASTVPLPWRSAFSRFAPVVKLGVPGLASVSNSALKRTRILRAAYLCHWPAKNPLCSVPCLIQWHLPSKTLSAGFFALCRASLLNARPVSSLFGL